MTIAPEDRTWFNHVPNTKIVALPDITSVNAPELGELLAGDVVDLTCDVPANGGLSINRPTTMVANTPWFGNHTRQYPTRWAPTVALTAPVPSQCDACTLGHRPDHPDCCFGALWDLSCRIQCPVVLVVRRGCPATQPFRVGDRVEVIRGRWGVRDIAELEDGPAMFTAPVGVVEEVGFDPDDETVCSGTTQIVPGTTPLPCGLRLCDGNGAPLCDDQNECFVNCDEEGTGSS